MKSMTRVVRTGDASGVVGRVIRIVDDEHVEVAWGADQTSEQPATHIEFSDELLAAS